MEIDVCFSPALYPVYHRPEAVVVVVDVFRATTTIATAFANGVRSILPVATTDEAEVYKELNWLVGAERNVQRCSFADFGNSPFDYTPEKVTGKDLVFTTTNGTRALHCAQKAYRIVIGAFVNLQAVADYCLHEKRDVVVLCSGWKDKFNKEDTLFGGALVELLQSHGYSLAGDAAEVALSLWRDGKADLQAALAHSEHIARLRSHGLENDIDCCLTLNLSPRTPTLHPDGCLYCS